MKKTIAIITGGFSSEQEVSLRSAQFVFQSIDKDLFTPYLVNISDVNWTVEVAPGEILPVDKTDFSFHYQGAKHQFQYAYVIIHGTPGENGLLQGYLDMLHIPYSCCGVLSAALTFNKFTCNQYLRSFGVSVAESILLRKGQTIAPEIVESQIGFPCFIKSNVGGSSYGCSKVKAIEEVLPAIDLAFAEGDEVIIEAFLEGTEVTCGIYKTPQVSRPLPITEVVTHNEFFDYDAKYNGQVEEITPARIPDEQRDRIHAITAHVYDILNCRGIIRVDYIIAPNGTINLLEVNTIPGMTATSFIPQQLKAAGLQVKSVLTEIISGAC